MNKKDKIDLILGIIGWTGMSILTLGLFIPFFLCFIMVMSKIEYGDWFNIFKQISKRIY